VTKLSPPDAHGYCSFGNTLWLAKRMLERAPFVIAEIDESFIRTGGDNFVHISQVDYCIKSTKSSQMPYVQAIPGEREPAIAAIGALVNSLVRDGDTLQFGAGKVSMAMPLYLFDKHDLGVHSEATPPSTVDLVRTGVVNGSRKEIHKGKVVATFFPASKEDLEFIDRNPVFELYAIDYVDDPRTISSHSNFVAINQGFAIDLTGQLNAEGLDTVPYSGPGGQPDFVHGALLSKGGRSITVLQSTAKNGSVSTIVPQLPLGAPVTISRNYIDFVVTEHGIASLQGKTLRQRAEELISVAHPDFRAELRAQAGRLGL
jgi:4-hydroxybutyrate CoA-transferase